MHRRVHAKPRFFRAPALTRSDARAGAIMPTERVFADAHNGMLIISPRGVVLEANDAFCRATGYLADEVKGRRPGFLRPAAHGTGFHGYLWQSLRTVGVWRGELVKRCKDGSQVTDFVTVGAVRNRVGQTTHYVCVFSDIETLKERQRRLEQLAYFDSLTGLPNRLLLMDRLRQMCAAGRRHGRQLAVCYLDIDGFKSINDNLGHHAGDCVLLEVARRLSREVRSGDTVARLGGDEFVMLFSEPGTVADIQAVLDRIFCSLAALPIGCERRGISASVGITLVPMDDGCADTLLCHADKAMYQAKRSGRAGYCFFYPLAVGATLPDVTLEYLACP